MHFPCLLISFSSLFNQETILISFYTTYHDNLLMIERIEFIISVRHFDMQ